MGWQQAVLDSRIKLSAGGVGGLGSRQEAFDNMQELEGACHIHLPWLNDSRRGPGKRRQLRPYRAGQGPRWGRGSFVLL